MAEFPITMAGMRPLTTAQINGRDVEFTIDSGAFFSMLSSASASELDLKTHFAPFGLYVTGVNGNASVSVATVKVFTLAGVPLHDVDFLVGGSDVSGSVGLLGQNVLHIGDVEYDLGQGVIRLMRPDGCGKGFLAYWVKPNEGYSEMDIEPTSRERFNTVGHAFLRRHSTADAGSRRSGVSIYKARSKIAMPHSAARRRRAPSMQKRPTAADSYSYVSATTINRSPITRHPSRSIPRTPGRSMVEAWTRRTEGQADMDEAVRIWPAGRRGVQAAWHRAPKLNVEAPAW
jgi:hypothetical protein